MGRPRVVLAGRRDATLALERVLAKAVDVVAACELDGLVHALRAATPELALVREERGALDAVARAMRTAPLPILVVGDGADGPIAARAVAAGGVDGLGLGADADRDARRLLRRIDALRRVPVVRRTGAVAPTRAAPQVVLVGSSTGGPPVLEALLRELPAPFPLPVVLAQHVAAGFEGGLARWLAAATGHRVRVAEGPTALVPGEVLVAPEHAHLVLTGARAAGLRAEAPHRFHRPSVDLLFESAARVLGPAAGALLLTGMGRDGAEGLLALREAGACTIVQSPASCVVDSMPRAAIELGAAEHVLPVAQLGPTVRGWGAPELRLSTTGRTS